MSAVITLFTTLFGLLIGSFLNVIIERVPKRQSIISPRSKCPKCEALIKWYQNIPVISYLFLRGKCANCEVRISISYPLVEVLCGIFAFWLAPKSFAPEEILNFSFYFSIACIFLALFIIDVEHHLLPDKINIYLLLIILPYVVLSKPIAHWLFGGIIGFFGPYLVTYTFYKIKGQIGLGGGDIKLFGILGILLGPIGVMNTIFMSCFLGSMVGLTLIVLKKLDRNSPLAFGPYILVVAAIQIFFPDFFNQINFMNLS